MIRVARASSGADYRKAAELLRQFPIHQHEYYSEHIAIVSRYFDADAYEREMAGLEQVYGPPGGCVLIALQADALVGAVCLHRLDDHACEMKRLFVPVAHRRKGIARLLTEELFSAARGIGYSVMRLDTGTFMVESQALYRSMGFRYIGPYYTVREELRDGLVYMEITL